MRLRARSGLRLLLANVNFASARYTDHSGVFKCDAMRSGESMGGERMAQNSESGTEAVRRLIAFLERFRDVPAAAWGISTGMVTVFAGYYSMANPGWPPRTALLVLTAVVAGSVVASGAYTLARPSRSERILRAQRDYDKGCSAFEDKRYVEAAGLFDKAREMDERYSYESKYGRVCLRLGQYESAVAAFTRAYQLASVKSERAAARRNRGVGFLVTRQWGSALNDFNEYLESNKKSSVILRHRALVHFHRGDFAKAATDARAATRIAPTNSAPYSTLAIILMASRDPEGARRNLQKAVQANPETPAGQYALAQACSALGDVDEAYRALAAAVQTDSRFSPRADLDPLFDPLRSDSARFSSAIEVLEWKFLGSLEEDA